MSGVPKDARRHVISLKSGFDSPVCRRSAGGWLDSVNDPQHGRLRPGNLACPSTDKTSHGMSNQNYFFAETSDIHSFFHDFCNATGKLLSGVLIAVRPVVAESLNGKLKDLS